MPDLDPDSALFLLRNLAMAGVVGFLIGFEREWTQEREGRKHSFAGARTFTLIAATGALTTILSGGALLVAAGLLAIGVMTVVAYFIEAKEAPGRGGTTEMAIFAAYLLGAAAGRGEMLIAAAGAVAVAIVLSAKGAIEHWARALDRHEIHASLRFLALAVLVLPILPDRDFGPYDALNARDLWKMVVFISGLSFLGYWLVKALGAERGVLVMGIVGGLASSTATTLSLSRFVKEGKSTSLAAAAGIIMANVVMLMRVGVLLSAVARGVLALVWPALVAGAIVGAAIAYVMWRRSPKSDGGDRAVDLGNPFELKPALFFAFLLAVISVAAAYGADKFGAGGLYLVGLISGLADVDAVTLSVGKQAAAGSVAATIAGGAVLIAVASNIAVKGGMALSIGGRKTGLAVLAAFAAISAAGALAFFVT